jgi:hypothetical protein
MAHWCAVGVRNQLSHVRNRANGYQGFQDLPHLVSRTTQESSNIGENRPLDLFEWSPRIRMLPSPNESFFVPCSALLTDIPAWRESRSTADASPEPRESRHKMIFLLFQTI